MKRILIIITFGLLFIFNTYAQENNKIGFQINGGTSLSVPYKSMVEDNRMINGDSYFWGSTKYQTNFGYFVDLLVSYRFTKRLSTVLGANYTFTTASVENRRIVFVDEGVIINSYIKFPLSIKYQLSESFPINISVGPYLGFLMKAEEKGRTEINEEMFNGDLNDPTLQILLGDYEDDIRKDYHRIDYGMALQLDYEKRVNKKFLAVLLARFNYGLKNILTNDLDNRSQASEWRNYSFEIGLGLKI